MVNEVIFATNMQLSPTIDTLVTELNIVTTDAGRYSTSVNGVLLPVDSFYTFSRFPYYYACIFYANNAPDLLHIENPNGFVASMNQFAYYLALFTHHDSVSCDVRYATAMGMCHSGCNGDIKASLDALDLSPVKCSNDTLKLHVLNNWFNYPISWIIGNNYYPNRDSVEFPLIDSGLLEIKLIIDKTCPDTVTKHVYVVIPPIIVDMPKDTAICPGQVIRIYSPNTDHYEWSNGTKGITLRPQYSGNYTLTASNYCYSIEKNMYVALLDCDNDIYVPNAFTPNGNGWNETFKPVFSRPEYIEQYKFFIYNRWGNLIYFTKDLYDGWTGYGSDEGGYVYVIEYKNRHEKSKQIKGTITLIR
jgi:gliding motility-associated-like protein